jgi:medium-chain acyl-[acyl-carrier-protein] hydrolase
MESDLRVLTSARPVIDHRLIGDPTRPVHSDWGVAAVSTAGDGRDRARDHESLRLWCLPYAGGGAGVFRGWVAAPPGVVVVASQLPGREERFGEPAHDTHAPLIDELIGETAQIMPPFALFGHSMGALLAFELARRMPAAGPGAPVALIVCGHRAPHLPNRYPQLRDLGGDELVEELRRLGGTPAEVFEQSELLELLLPLLRADFAVCESYEIAPGPPLCCPIIAFGGRGDRLVESWELEAWRQHTTGAFALRWLDGDHFFPWEPDSGLKTALTQELFALRSAGE